MRVIRKATEKDQNLRYQTASEFKRAIEEALLPDPTLSEKIAAWITGNILLVSIVLSAIMFGLFLGILLLIA